MLLSRISKIFFNDDEEFKEKAQALLCEKVLDEDGKVTSTERREVMDLLRVIDDIHDEEVRYTPAGGR